MSPGGLSSMNPFGGSKSASTSKRNNDSFVSKTKGVFVRSRDAVANTFSRKPSNAEKIASEVKSDVDPLRLDNKPDVGPDVFVANGRLWESTGNSQKAMESYTRALKIAPNDPDALASIARLQFREENFKQAANFFQQAIKVNAEDAGLHNDLGLAQSKLGETGAATMSLTRALELSPGMSRYANNLASVKFDSGDAAGAYKVLASNNAPAIAHYNMAYLHQKQGQLNKSREHLQEALKYENLGKTDSSIARAVSRSKELLASLDGPAAMKPGTAIANSKPTVTTPPATLGQKTGETIRQTSQSSTGEKVLNVKPASVQVPTPELPPSTLPASTDARLPSAAKATMPKSDVSTDGYTSAAKRSTPARFATARLGATKVEKSEPAASQPANSGSTGPFTLPAGFNLPTQ